MPIERLIRHTGRPLISSNMRAMYWPMIPRPIMIMLAANRIVISSVAKPLIELPASLENIASTPSITAITSITSPSTGIIMSGSELNAVTVCRA
jgi:hypothetical protein